MKNTNKRYRIEYARNGSRFIRDMETRGTYTVLSALAKILNILDKKEKDNEKARGW